MADDTHTSDADVDALLRGPSDSARLLALRRLAQSGRADLRTLLEPLAQKDRSFTVRYLARRVLRALDGAPAGFGDLDPEPASAGASGSRPRPTALVAALREAGTLTPVAGTPAPRRPAAGPPAEITGPVRRDVLVPPGGGTVDPNVIALASLEDEPTSRLPAVPAETVAAPLSEPESAARAEAQRLERAALAVLRPCVRQLAALAEARDDDLAAECALALGRLRAIGDYDVVAGRARSAPPDERFIRALGEIGDPRAVEVLSRFWRDPRWQALRPAIGVAACHVQSTRAEEFLRQALQEEDLAVQGAIIRHLEASRDARFVDLLLGKLGRVEELEVLVIQALARFAASQPRVVHALLSRLPHEQSPRTSSCIISALAESGAPALVEALEQLLRHRDRRVRANAVDAVERLAAAPDVKRGILRPLLADDDNRVRANAARQLVQLGDARALEVLRAMLGHKDRWWRASACHALGECRPPGTATLLARALRDPDVEVRLNAAKALREVSDPSVPQLLISLLADRNLYIRLHAVEAVAGRSVRAAASAVRAMVRQETSPQVIAAALLAVARTSSLESALREITPYLGNAAAGVRLAAVEALEPLLDGPSIGALKPALADADRRVRAAAVRAYVRAGQLRVLSTLHDALLADDRAEQLAAAHALGELAPVVRGLRDAGPPARLAEALRKVPAYAAEEERHG